MRRLFHFLKANHHKWLTFQIIWYLAWYRFCLWHYPIEKLKVTWGTLGEDTAYEDEIRQYSYAKLVGRYVSSYARKTPWESKCLVQALTARKMMKKRHYATTLYLGVQNAQKSNLVAHAWIRSGTFYLTGGNGEGYTIVASFATK